uniref:TIGR02099 family protein n=1 Tax=Candidatus Kentrum sp. FM TaxID=2126340 RepID=A0A450SE14_9GAMM|nr:MAG: TIGR02099 family protein [Candidatus Kentron sp. FM]VFJ50863.1 MAG: TIGR02099 family protein [Candidatus Kentron sp. FM]VFK06378.1 MAG: TIGR02099 family protein [Candidatus Kentron sp. FM]
MIIQGLDKLSGHETPARERKIRARGWPGFLSVIWGFAILITVSLIVVRLSLPSAARFLPDVERWLHGTVGQTVSIGSLHIGWHGWTPRLSIEDIRLPDSTEDAPRIQSLWMDVGIDFSSLWKDRTWGINAIRAKKLLLSGASLTVIRDSDGGLRLAGTGQTATGLLPWLLQQPHIDAKSIDISFRDEENDGLSFSLRNARFGIHRNGARHRVFVTLSPYRGHSAEAGSHESSIGANGFLRVDHFDPNRFPLLQNAVPSLPTYGVTHLDVWTSWNQGQLEYAKGDFTLGDSIPTSTDSNTGDREKPAGLSGKDHCVPPCAVPEQDKVAARETAEGEIAAKEITGSLELARVGIDNWQVRVRGLSLTTPQRQWPATDGQLRIVRSRNQHGWLLEIRNAKLTNEDITLRLAGTGQWFEDNSSPDVRLVMAIDEGKLHRLTRYLPTELMKKSLVTWLGNAFPKGRLDGGEILFHGRVADFPFDNGKGVFEARLKTSRDTTFSYARVWQSIEALAADIVFENEALTITANTGLLYGAGIREVVAEIPNITAQTPMLTVNGHAVGNLEEGLTFLRTGPLSDRYGHRVAGIEGTGEYRLDLQMQLPLSRIHRTRTQGRITFLDNSIGIDTSRLASDATGSDTRRNDDLHLSFHRVNGTLAFDKQGMTGKGIAARYLDQPVTLGVAKATECEESIRFTIDNLTTGTLFSHPLLKTTAQEIQSWLSPLIGDMTNKATWQVALDLPNSWGQKDNRKPAKLRISSPLGEIGAALPAPLARPFQAEMLLSKRRSERRITIKSGTELTGVFVPGKRSEEGDRQWCSAVRLGKGPVNTPAEGIRIDGHIRHLSLDRWIPLFKTGLAKSKWLAKTPRLSATQTPAFPVKIPSDLLGTDAKTAKTASKPAPTVTIQVPEQFDIRVDKLTAFARTFRDITLKAGSTDDGSWYILIQGKQAKGYVRFPGAGAQEPIVADFAHLQLPAADDSGKRNEIDPRNIPSIRFTCKNLTYDGRPLGNTRLELVQTPQGINIETIDISSRNLQVQGNGTWEYPAQPGQSSSRSRLQVLEIRSRNLGKLLSSFGYGRKVAKKGKTYLKLSNATWPGSPAQFELERMSGNLDIKITDGRLLAIEPGTTGRVFGLLSFTQLTRRLSLDFKDFYKEGFTYDRIEGKFRIEQGRAKTDDFVVEGTSSRIDIVGNTGLVNKDYDQVATVIPKLATTTVPVPTIGIPLAAIGIAQHLLDKPFFDKVFAYQYTIKGTWADPKIELVQNNVESE